MSLEDSKTPKLRWLTRSEAAKYLRVNPQTFKRYRDEIPSHKLGGRYFYTKEELDGLVRPCARGGNFADIFPWGLGSGRTYLTRKETAEYLRMSMVWLKRYPKKIPAYKLFSRV
ncbi:MAG: helix-turn-helix domain-containing protein, partial [Puniceicoccales bacterium]|nr:helix-turn-helix domain-containing protein [Puniceicoccales bacterium]